MHWQVPRTHVAPIGHATPHFPQLLLSVLRSTQALLQVVVQVAVSGVPPSSNGVSSVVPLVAHATAQATNAMNKLRIPTYPSTSFRSRISIGIATSVIRSTADLERHVQHLHPRHVGELNVHPTTERHRADEL